jgi:hypothetical protein
MIERRWADVWKSAHKLRPLGRLPQVLAPTGDEHYWLAFDAWAP